MPKALSRRSFLKITGTGSISLILSACGTEPTTIVSPTSYSPPPTPTKREQPSPKIPTPTPGTSRRRGTLTDALIYYVGYATEENMLWIEQFDADILVRGFLLFLNTNDSWISFYRSQMEKCQNEGRLFLTAIQAAVLVEDGKDLPQIEQDDPAFAVPMDSIHEWEEYACRTPSGLTLIDKGLPFAHACMNNTDFQELFKRKLEKIVDTDSDGVHIDELPTRYFTMHEGYCDACMSGFKEYLAQRYLPPELNARFGISDIAIFDFRDHLAASGFLETPPRSPLHTEWWLFQLSNLAKIENELLSSCKNYAASKGKQFLLNSNAFEPEHEPKHIIEMTLTDFASIGTNMSINLNIEGQIVSTLRIPPNYSYIPVYRLAHGIMPGKPISLFIDGPGGANMMRSLPEQRQKDIVRWLFAEAYAANSHFNIPYPSVGYYGPLNECQQYTQFLNNFSSIASDAKHLAEVGVMFSYASQIWDYWEEVDRRESNHNRQWYGLMQALTDLSIQSDVIFAPDGHVIPDSLTLEDLLKYQTIIIPWIYSINDAQVGLLAEYTQNGGNLFILGDFAVFDEGKNQRHVSIATNFQRFGATILPDLDLEVYLNDPEGQEAPRILDELKKMFQERWLSVTNTSVTVQLNQNDTGLYCHLINKELQEAGFQTQRDFIIQITLPSGFEITESETSYLSPETPDSKPILLPITQQGSLLKITIPSLEVYGILMIPGKA